MKILWLTNTPSNASAEFGYSYCGGGWISSLETLIAESGIHKLAICFFYDGNNFRRLEINSVIYFGIPGKSRNGLKRIMIRHLTQMDDEENSLIEKVIDEFQPDLIHVFGTESGFGKILMHRTEKVIFNFQGLMQPISEAYIPRGFSPFKILKASSLNSILRGLTPVHDYKMFCKKAVRERSIIKFWKYFIGRTEWNRNFLEMTNPEAKYFHCEEMLRTDFYAGQWDQPSEMGKDNPIVIGSTISPNLYKGLDLVYKVILLLEDFNIQWKIFGIEEEDFINRISKKLVLKSRKKPEIKFFGMLSASDLIVHLKTCHFFVHPSYIDNSPNSVCEAMLMGMPVLASSVGGIRTMVQDSETGFLFNPYDKYDLAGLLVHLINNYEIAKQAGIRARQIALIRHSPENILSELNRIYNFVYSDKYEINYE